MRGNNFYGNNPMNMIQKFNQFKQQFQNQDPQKMVQQLLDSGKMSQEQFKQFKESKITKQGKCLMVLPFYL